jgi:pyroglutamyl-peptidase
MNPSTLLLTGFEPFGGDAVNPSWLVAQALHGQVIEGARVQSLCLPCVFGDAVHTLQAAARRHRPRVVLALGLAANRSALSMERVAINVDDARIPDNAGAQPVDEPVVAGGPVAYFSRLPIKAIVQALQEAGVPAEVSQTAGTFVCNHVFYGLMHMLRRRTAVRAGFMHLPLLPEQAAAVGLPGLDLDTQVLGVRLALRQAALATAGDPQDLRLGGGAIA